MTIDFFKLNQNLLKNHFYFYEYYHKFIISENDEQIASPKNIHKHGGLNDNMAKSTDAKKETKKKPLKSAKEKKAEKLEKKGTKG